MFIKGDGEFKSLQDLIQSELYGGPTLNPASANKHVPEIERKIHVIKEQIHAVRYSVPCNALPVLVDSFSVVCHQTAKFIPNEGRYFGLEPKTNHDR